MQSLKASCLKEGELRFSGVLDECRESRDSAEAFKLTHNLTTLHVPPMQR